MVDSLWEYLIIFASIFLCAWLFNKWIEAIMLCVAHTCIRNAFDKQFHFNSTAYCLSLTLAIIWFAIPITLPITTSLLSSIPISFLISFFGFITQDRVDLLIEKRNRAKFNLEHCTKEKLIEICDLAGYNKDKRELAIMFFIDKLSNKQVWEILCNTQRNVEWDTVKKYRYRMNKELRKFMEE